MAKQAQTVTRIVAPWQTKASKNKDGGPWALKVRTVTRIVDPGAKKYRQSQGSRAVGPKSADSYKDGGPRAQKVPTVIRIGDSGAKNC